MHFFCSHVMNILMSQCTKWLLDVYAESHRGHRKLIHLWKKISSAWWPSYNNRMFQNQYLYNCNCFLFLFLFSVLFSFYMWSWYSLLLLAAGLISSEKMWPMNVFIIFHLKHIHVICEPFVINLVRGKPSNCYNVCQRKCSWNARFK